MPRKKFHVHAQHLQEVMEESLPKMVDARVQELTKTQVLIYVAQGLIMERRQSQADVAKIITDAIKQEYNLHLQQDDLPIWLVLKYKFERLHVSDTCRPFSVRLRDYDNLHDDAHTEEKNSAKRQKMSEHETYVFVESSSSQANENDNDDDEFPIEKVSQELMEEMSQSVDEAKLHKVVNKMLRQRC
nr:hypothetical protein [Tanacetum cinerariifolium]